MKFRIVFVLIFICLWNFCFTSFSQTIHITLSPNSSLLNSGTTNIILGGANDTTHFVNLGGTFKDPVGNLTIKGITYFSGGTSPDPGNTTDPYLKQTGNLGELNILTIDQPNLTDTSRIDGNTGSLIINKTIVPNRGALLSNNGRLVLKSSKNTELYNGNPQSYGIPTVIGRSNCSNGVPDGKVLGDIYVERPISTAQYGTRFLTPGLNPSKTIYETYQESGTATPGYGIHLFKNGTDKSDGFDIGNNAFPNGSIAYFNNQNSAWAYFPATNELNENWGLGKGVIAVVYGDRTYTPFTIPTANSRYTILRTYGSVNQCDFNFNSFLKQGTELTPSYSLIGNPFWAYFNLAPANIEHTDISGYSYYNPSVAGTGNNKGSYENVNFSNPYPNDLVTLQPGQSFFVSIIGPSPSLTLKASGIQSDTTLDGKFQTFGKLTSWEEREHIIIEGLVNSLNPEKFNETPFSKVRTSFSKDFSNEIGKEDTPLNFRNAFENLAIKHPNSDLIIEGRKPVETTDTLHLALSRLFNEKDPAKNEKIKYAFRINTNLVNGDKLYSLYNSEDQSFIEIPKYSNEIYPLDIPVNTKTIDKYSIIIMDKSYQDYLNYHIQRDPDGIFTYPNPTSQFVHVLSNNLSESIIEIVNMRGIIVETRKLPANTPQKEEIIDLSKYPTGNYLIRLKNKDGRSFTKKIIKNQ